MQPSLEGCAARVQEDGVGRKRYDKRVSVKEPGSSLELHIDMYAVGSMFLKKQNKLQSNGRGRRKGAVGEESTRQLQKEQTLL